MQLPIWQLDRLILTLTVTCLIEKHFENIEGLLGLPHIIQKLVGLVEWNPLLLAVLQEGLRGVLLIIFILLTISRVDRIFQSLVKFFIANFRFLIVVITTGCVDSVSVIHLNRFLTGSYEH